MANLPFAQGKSGTGTGKNPTGVAYASNCTSGSLLICMVYCNNSGADTLAVSDSVNGAWTPIGSLQAIGSGSGQAFYFNGNTSTSTPTVSAVWTGGTTPGTSTYLIMEYTDQKSSSPLDVSAYNTYASSSGPFTATVTTNQTNEQVIELLISTTASNWTINNSFNLRVGGAVTYEGADIAANSPGSVTGSITPDRSNGDVIIAVLGFLSTTSALPAAATPTFSPNGGAFGPSQTVTITSSTSGGTIFYTTDGSTPTHGSSSVANGGTVSISTTCTLKAIESASGFSDSAVGSASFTINGAVTTSTFSPTAGTYSSTQSVTLANADSALTGFAQYYTTDGSTPTTGSTLYTGAISVVTSQTIKVLAVATNYSNSSIPSAAYVISGGGSGIGTVMTGAAIGIKVVNSAGYDTPITSPTVGLHIGLPIPVVFCDPNGNEYTVTGATKGSFVKNPIPVVLTDPNGQPIVPPIVLTSNGNSISITATLTGTKMGQPTPVALCDNNGFLYTLTGFSYSSGAQKPTSVCLCDIHGNVITMTIGT